MFSLSLHDMTDTPYTAKLQSGLGLIAETNRLIQLWTPGMDASTLYRSALTSGAFHDITARRLLNIIKECFTPRFLVLGDHPAKELKAVQDILPPYVFEQILFLYAIRANRILADFLMEVYWPHYHDGFLSLTNTTALEWVAKANQEGKTTSPWSESTQRKVASYLTGICADFRLLEPGTRSERRILAFHPAQETLIWLAHDLHFQGLGDNAMIQREEWAWFGLEDEAIRSSLRQIAPVGRMIVQATGTTIHIDWTYTSWQELIHGYTER